MQDHKEKQQLTTIRLRAMNILAGREHSIVELQTKLSTKLSNKLKRQLSQQDNEFYVDKLHLEQQIAIVLKQLIADDCLNEERFTECFVRSRINKGSGPVKIRHELMERGISNELCDLYLDNSYEFWKQHINTVREKHFGVQYPNDYKQQAKQSRFLYQRGFSGEFIRRLFNENS